MADDVNLHAPVVSITSLDDGGYVSGVVTITGTASDEDGDGTILFFGMIPAPIIIPMVLIAVFVTRQRNGQAAYAGSWTDDGEICPTCRTTGEYEEEHDSLYCWECEEFF